MTETRVICGVCSAQLEQDVVERWPDGEPKHIVWRCPNGSHPHAEGVYLDRGKIQLPTQLSSDEWEDRP